MPAITDLDDLVALDHAANLLNAVGRVSDDSRIAIRCLLATDALARAGAHPSTAQIDVADRRSAIAEALRALGSVDDDVLDDDAIGDDVTDAMQYALLAHAATA